MIRHFERVTVFSIFGDVHLPASSHEHISYNCLPFSVIIFGDLVHNTSIEQSMMTYRRYTLSDYAVQYSGPLTLLDNIAYIRTQYYIIHVYYTFVIVVSFYLNYSLWIRDIIIFKHNIVHRWLNVYIILL